HARIPASVVDEVELGVVADPSPDAPAAALPLVGGPARHAEILAPEPVIEGLEPRPDLHVFVGAAVVRLPDDLAVAEVERRDPAAHAQLATAVADEDSVPHDERRHGHGLAAADVAQ